MNWLLKVIVGKYGQSIVRHLLTLVSGWFIAIGIPETTTQAFVEVAHPIAIAVSIYLSTQVWSLVDKKK